MTAQWEQPPETTEQRAVRIARVARATGIDTAEYLERMMNAEPRFANSEGVSVAGENGLEWWEPVTGSQSAPNYLPLRPTGQSRAIWKQAAEYLAAQKEPEAAPTDHSWLVTEVSQSKPTRILGLRPHTLVVVLYIGIALLVALILAVLLGGA